MLGPPRPDVGSRKTSQDSARSHASSGFHSAQDGHSEGDHHIGAAAAAAAAIAAGPASSSPSSSRLHASLASSSSSSHSKDTSRVASTSTAATSSSSSLETPVQSSRRFRANNLLSAATDSLRDVTRRPSSPSSPGKAPYHASDVFDSSSSSSTAGQILEPRRRAKSPRPSGISGPDQLIRPNGSQGNLLTVQADSIPPAGDLPPPRSPLSGFLTPVSRLGRRLGSNASATREELREQHYSDEHAVASSSSSSSMGQKRPSTSASSHPYTTPTDLQADGQADNPSQKSSTLRAKVFGSRKREKSIPAEWIRATFTSPRPPMVEEGAGPSSLQGGPPAPSSDLPFNDTFQSPFAHSGGALGLTAVPLEISPSTVGPGPPPGSSALRLESTSRADTFALLQSAVSRRSELRRSGSWPPRGDRNLDSLSAKPIGTDEEKRSLEAYSFGTPIRQGPMGVLDSSTEPSVNGADRSLGSQVSSTLISRSSSYNNVTAISSVNGSPRLRKVAITNTPRPVKPGRPPPGPPSSALEQNSNTADSPVQLAYLERSLSESTQDSTGRRKRLHRTSSGSKGIRHRRPISVASVASESSGMASWHSPLPRSSSLRETHRQSSTDYSMPTPPPRSSSSSHGDSFDLSSATRHGISLDTSTLADHEDEGKEATEDLDDAAQSPGPSAASRLAALVRLGGSIPIVEESSKSSPTKSTWNRPDRLSRSFSATMTKAEIKTGPPRPHLNRRSTAEAADAARSRTASMGTVYEDAMSSRPTSGSRTPHNTLNSVESHTFAASDSEGRPNIAAKDLSRPVKPAKNPLRQAVRNPDGQDSTITPSTSGLSVPTPIERTPSSQVSDLDGLAAGVPYGKSPARSSIEAAYRLAGHDLMLTKTTSSSRRPGDKALPVPPKAGLPTGLSEPLQLTTGTSHRSAVAEQDSESSMTDNEKDDEGAEREAAGQDRVTPMEGPTTPGEGAGNSGFFSHRAKTLRKVTPPSLASAFRARKSISNRGSSDAPSSSVPTSAIVSESGRSKKWPFGKDAGSDGEDDSSKGDKKAKKALRKPKEAAARPEIRRVYQPTEEGFSTEERSNGTPVSPTRDRSASLRREGSTRSVASIKSYGSTTSIPQQTADAVSSPTSARRKELRNGSVSWTKDDLDEQGKRILKRRNIIRELVSTEKSYAADLLVVRDVYLTRAKAKAGIPASLSPATGLTPSASPALPQQQLFQPTGSSQNQPYRSPVSPFVDGSAARNLMKGSRSVSSNSSPATFAEGRFPGVSPVISTYSIGTPRDSESNRSSAAFGESTVASADEKTRDSQASLEDNRTTAGSMPRSGSVASLGTGSDSYRGLRPQMSIDTRTRIPSYGSLAGLPPPVADAPLTASDIRIIFAGVELCASFAEEMATMLDAAMGSTASQPLPEDSALLSDSQDDCVGRLFCDLASRIRHVYASYCSKHEASMAKLREVSMSTRAAAFLHDCTTVARRHTNAWDLASLLIKPVQRMLKYPLLLDQILSTTPASHPDYTKLKAAKEELQRIADSINELNRRNDIIKKIVGNANSGATSLPTSRSGTISGKSHDAKASVLTLRKKQSRHKEGKDAVPPLEVFADLLEGQDVEYLTLITSFRAQEEGLDRIARHCLAWSEASKACLRNQVHLLLQWVNVYQLGGLETAGTDEAVTAVKEILSRLGEASEAIWTRTESQIRNEVLPALEKLRRMFDRPKAYIIKRDEREEDYLRYRSATANRNGAKIDRKLLESANGFVALHSQLLEELPMFIAGIQCGTALVVTNLAKMQTSHFHRLHVLIEGYVSGQQADQQTMSTPTTATAALTIDEVDASTPAGQISVSRQTSPTVREIVHQWWAVHQPLADLAGQLAICQRSQAPEGSVTGAGGSRRPSAAAFSEDAQQRRSVASSGSTGGGADSSTSSRSRRPSQARPRPSLSSLKAGGSSRPSEDVAGQQFALLSAPLVDNPMRGGRHSNQASPAGSPAQEGSPMLPSPVVDSGPRLVNVTSTSSHRRPSATAGNILRSISGTFRNTSSSSQSDSAVEIPSPRPPVPPLPYPSSVYEATSKQQRKGSSGSTAGGHSPLPRSKTPPPMLPTLDLGHQHLSPSRRVMRLESSSESTTPGEVSLATRSSTEMTPFAPK